MLSPAVADADDFYVSLFAGGSVLTSSDNNFNFGGAGDAGFENEGGLIFGGAAGMQFFDVVRGEVEVSFQQFDDLNNVYSAIPGSFDNGTSVEALYFLANVWYDFELTPSIQPYVGGGVGGAWTEARSSNIAAAGPEDEDIGFAFQVGAGVRIPVIENVDFDIGYRFKSVVDVSYDNLAGPGLGWSGGNLYSHNATAGITVHFGGN